MNNTTLKSRSKIIKSTARTSARWTVIALVGTGGGALFGLVFGAITTLAYGNPANIPYVTGYFAACGLAAGAMLAAFGTLIDDDDGVAADDAGWNSPADSSAASDSSSRFAALDLAQHRAFENRLAGLPPTNDWRAQRLATRNPSRN